MVESCKQVKPWRYAVTQAAVNIGAVPLSGPIWFTAEFIFPRPKAHFRANGQLKPSVPQYHSVKPDVSKLLRSTEDALTGVAYDDDARIAISTVHKRYAQLNELPGAIIVIRSAILS